MITLITMSQGNPLALKRTIDSFAGLCNEAVFGDMLIFGSDRDVIDAYGVKSVNMPFNYIYKNGFAETLNSLAEHASNDWVIYMNVGEVMESEVLDFSNPTANCYCFDHATDPHKWFRLYNRHELKWNGLIHEELVGKRKTQHEPIFRMVDTHKDPEPFRAKVYNDVKEIVYFRQYMRLVEEPSTIGITNQGWVDYAHRDYNYIKERMISKGQRVHAFETGDLSLYLREVHSQEFSGEFHDTDIIHFQ